MYALSSSSSWVTFASPPLSLCFPCRFSLALFFADVAKRITVACLLSSWSSARNPVSSTSRACVGSRRGGKRNQTHLRHATSSGEQKSRCEKILEKCWQQPWRAHARVSNNKKRHTCTAPSHTDSTRDKRHTTTYVTQLSPFLLLALKWCHREPECKSIAPSPLCTKCFAWPHSQPLRGCNRFGVHTMHTTKPQRNVRWPWTAAATVYF